MQRLGHDQTLARDFDILQFFYAGAWQNERTFAFLYKLAYRVRIAVVTMAVGY
jgi:hypothetical protein